MTLADAEGEEGQGMNVRYIFQAEAAYFARHVICCLL